MKEMTNKSPCPDCRSEGGRNLYRMEQVEGVQYYARQCKGCGFRFLSPQPTDAFLSQHYAEAPVYGLASENLNDYRALIEDRKALLNRLECQPEGVSVDFGAALGVTVKACEELGYEANGVEISESARQSAARLFGLDLKDGGLENFEDGSLSLITLFDVLEHIPNPRAFLCAAHKKLKPGGQFIAGVPNYMSLDRILYGSGSRTLYFPQHVNYFTRGSLSRMYREAGFTLSYIGSPPPYAIAITFGLRKTMFKCFGYNPLTRLIRDVLSFIKRYIIYPLPNLIVEKTGLLGTSLVAVGRA